VNSGSCEQVLTTQNRSLRFSTKHFWFGAEPIGPDSLGSYLREEREDHAYHNVAHASETGKGLLLYSKRQEDKSHPQGILNLVS